MDKIQEVIQRLQSTFAIKDLGPLHCFLAVEAIRNSNGLFLSQRRHIVDLLRRTNMDGAKPQKTPIYSTNKLSKLEGPAFHDATLYRSIVGALEYPTLT